MDTSTLMIVGIDVILVVVNLLLTIFVLGRGIGVVDLAEDAESSGNALSALFTSYPDDSYFGLY